MQYIIETLPTNFSVRRSTEPLRPVPHIHRDLELIFNLRGSTVASLDNKKYYVNPGEVFLAFPNQIHSYRDADEREGFCVIFSNDLYKDLQGLFLNKVPEHSVLTAEQLPPDISGQLERIYSLHAAGDDICAQGLFLLLLGQLLPAFTMVPSSGDPDTIKSILSYCFSNFREPVSLNSAAQALHLSKFYICHIFKERMGMGFTAFINLLRTEHACQLLSKDISITDVAFLSGFSSTRSFNRVFLEQKGMPPRKYRSL